CYRAVEASEDDPQAARMDLEARGFSNRDVLVGIAASGRTPYTVGGVSYARSLGALTIAVTCVPNSPITEAAEIRSYRLLVLRSSQVRLDSRPARRRRWFSTCFL